MIASPGPENGAATGVRIPTLTTERLTLRAPGPEDFEPIAAFFETERSRFVGGPRGRFASWRAFAAVLGQWHLKGWGMWAVEIREGAGFAGMVGCHDPEGWLAPEIGWMIMEPAAEGHGYAHEAALAARAQAYGPFGWREAFSVIGTGNDRSVALARRLGCMLERRAEWEGEPVDIWRHPGPKAGAP